MLLKYAFNGGYLLAFVWGIYRLHTGLVTFGTLTAFLQLVSRIQGPVLTAIAFVPAAIRCRTAVERLITMNEEECEVRSPPYLSALCKRWNFATSRSAMKTGK